MTLLRGIDDALRTIVPADSKAAGVQVHGNRIVAHEVFARLDLTRLADPAFDLGSLLSQVDLLTVQVHQATADAFSTLFPSSYPGSLFKNAGKCAELSATIAKALPR